ncbi:hypothetical protein [Aliarcobacter skirrowii]|nr:hypothetical protein [Aliarcobacter skirrowii]SUV14753.1 Uncharacterised protein [Aliarcobacter skirrowii]
MLDESIIKINTICKELKDAKKELENIVENINDISKKIEKIEIDPSEYY